MPEIHTIVDFFRRNFQFEITEEVVDLLEQSFKKEHFRKKEVVFTSGESNTRHYFIEKGLMRLYVSDQMGKEFNILFARENQVIGDLATPNPTDFYLAAVEDTTAFSIGEDKLQELVRMGGWLQGANNDNTLRRSYISMQKRLVSILVNTAEENYLAFRKKYPELIQRLPQYHIASYLGISPEFLSKTIARTTNKK